MTAIATRKNVQGPWIVENRPKEQEMSIQGLKKKKKKNMISVSMVKTGPNSRKMVFATILTSFEAFRKGLRRTSSPTDNCERQHQ